jgi:hypothetical protein
MAASALLLSGCISDQQAVDLGLATACEGETTYSPVGDAAGRYWKGQRSEICKGAKKDAGNRMQTVLIDCAVNRQFTATGLRQMADQRRHGPDFDQRATVDTQVLRLKLGLADLAGAEQALRAAGVPVTAAAGGAEQCRQAAPAALSN